MTVIALDVGNKRIGVAASDPGGSFAFPVATLERTSLRRDIAAIVAMAAERDATTIVVGDPISLSGHRGPQAKIVDAFCASLAAGFAGTIERVDERLTTSAATDMLIEADVSRKKRKGVVDQLAATLILETYLAKRRSRST
jgi:putative Holliday junction resolvase